MRRIGVTSLPPIGCLPAAITLFGAGSNQCVGRLNRDAMSFNYILNSTSQSLVDKLPGLKLVVFDIYHPLLDMITRPSETGNMLTEKRCLLEMSCIRSPHCFEPNKKKSTFTSEISIISLKFHEFFSHWQQSYRKKEFCLTCIVWSQSLMISFELSTRGMSSLIYIIGMHGFKHHPDIYLTSIAQWTGKS